jgi:hypothetical protein
MEAADSFKAWHLFTKLNDNTAQRTAILMLPDMKISNLITVDRFLCNYISKGVWYLLKNPISSYTLINKLHKISLSSISRPSLLGENMGQNKDPPRQSLKLFLTSQSVR